MNNVLSYFKLIRNIGVEQICLTELLCFTWAGVPLSIDLTPLSSSALDDTSFPFFCPFFITGYSSSSSSKKTRLDFKNRQKLHYCTSFLIIHYWTCASQHNAVFKNRKSIQKINVITNLHRTCPHPRRYPLLHRCFPVLLPPPFQPFVLFSLAKVIIYHI